MASDQEKKNGLPQPHPKDEHPSPEFQAAVREITALSATYSTELESKKSRLDELVKSHWFAVGSYKETLVRNLLQEKVPRRYEVGTGFVMTINGTGKLISRQIDILVWDTEKNFPFFRDGSFVIIAPEACKAAIEVKGNLASEELRDGLANLGSLDQFIPFARPETSLYRGIFAFDKSPKLAFPNSLLNAIHAHYHRATPSLEERIAWSRHSTRPLRIPWLHSIAILNHGVVSFEEWSVNGDTCAVYSAFETIRDGVNDTYGFVERDILVDLLVGRHRSTMHMTHPGMRNLLFHTRPQYAAGQASMILPKISPNEISSIGSMSEKQVKDIKTRLFKARKPSVRHKRNSKPNASTVP